MLSGVLLVGYLNYEDVRSSMPARKRAGRDPAEEEVGGHERALRRRTLRRYEPVFRFTWGEVSYPMDVAAYVPRAACGAITPARRGVPGAA